MSEFDGLVIFIAHNGHRFDHRILCHHFQELGVIIPHNFIFADSLQLMKRFQPGMKKYNLRYLCQAILQEDPSGLHQAKNDVDVLWQILRKTLNIDSNCEAAKHLANLCLKDEFGIPFQSIDELEIDLQPHDFDPEFD